MLNWYQLSALRSTSVLRVGYFGVGAVPLLSYIINQINKNIPEINLVLPSPLFWLFIGSFLLASAHLLNEILCPYIVKTYGSLDEYRASLANMIKNQELILTAHFKSKQDSYKQAFQNKAATDFQTLKDEDQARLAGAMSNVLANKFVQSAKEELPNIDYAAEWDRAIKWSNPLRIVISLLYLASAIIAAIQIVRQLVNVIDSAI